jgi:hypothetical protein
MQYILNLDKKNKKNNDVNETLFSIEYIDTTRYSNKNQRRANSKNDFICKYCKRRVLNISELRNHMLNKHAKK